MTSNLLSYSAKNIKNEQYKHLELTKDNSCYHFINKYNVQNYKLDQEFKPLLFLAFKTWKIYIQTGEINLGGWKDHYVECFTIMHKDVKIMKREEYDFIGCQYQQCLKKDTKNIFLQLQ